MKKEIPDAMKEARSHILYKFWFIIATIKIKIAVRLYKIADWLAE